MRYEYQPIINLRRLQVDSYEMLLRGVPRKWGSIQGYIVDSEQRGDICALDMAAVLTASHLLAARPELRLAVNVSARTCACIALHHFLRNELLRLIDDRGRLTIEVTETYDCDLTAMRELCAAAAATGVRIAVDDVDEPARLQCFLAFRPQVIKIDGAWFRAERFDNNLPTPGISEVVTQARRSGASVIVEGIEVAEDLQRARLLGASHGQGHFLGRPTAEIAPLRKNAAPHAGAARV